MYLKCANNAFYHKMYLVLLNGVDAVYLSDFNEVLIETYKDN